MTLLMRARVASTVLSFSLLVVVIAPLAGAERTTRRISFDASDALERGMEIDRVQHAKTGGHVILYDSTLIEDDGPGIGPDSPFLAANERSPVVKVGGPIQIKKILQIDRPSAMAVWLYTSQGVNVTINGARVQISADDRYPAIPPELLKRGSNEIIISCPADRPQTVKIAPRAAILRNAPDRKNRPPASFKSDDGGKTWQPLDGEAMVRLFLLQYAPTGSFASQVIDLASEDTTPLAKGPISIHSIALNSQADLPGGTAITFQIRTGSSPVYEPAHWSGWQPVAAPIKPDHRFIQWKAIFSSGDARTTPILRGVRLEASISREAPPAWATNIAVKAFTNPDIRYTSIPFEYEDPLNPRLASLRAKYHLDEIVSDSTSELEKLIKLRHWVHQQWKYKAPVDGWFPAWDADEILTKKEGFCVHFAIVYMQCAISLGYQTRYVFGGHPGTIVAGHEVCEVWSNQFQKWILMDPEGDLDYVDPTLGDNVPLSMIEAHDRILRTFYSGKMATYENRPRTPEHSPWLALCRGLSREPEEIFHAGDPPPKEWEPWMKWLNVRYMPRNNYLGRELPVPIEQGFHWDWPDYYIWHDAATPREWSYRHFVSRRSDLNWSINQVRFSAEASATKSALSLRLGSTTPYLQTYLMNIDGQDWKPTGAEFSWPLHSGTNHLEMRVRNTSAIEGPVSSIEVNNPN